MLLMIVGAVDCLKVLDGSRVQATLARQPLRLTNGQGCHTLTSCLTFWRLAFTKGLEINFLGSGNDPGYLLVAAEVRPGSQARITVATLGLNFQAYLGR